ncbi:MAG: hypothetical protein KDA22_11030, partial [Phycisphaerales bacterium]|nr:hypothetical protein [Phycisphaerales bacterium]
MNQPRPVVRRPLSRVVVVVGGMVASGIALVAAAAALQDGASPAAQDAPQPSRLGRVVDAPRSVRDFAPPDTSVEVDASTASIHQILSDLGPDATQ